MERRRRSAPSPQRGEGWGEGGRTFREKTDMASTVEIARHFRRQQTDAERYLWFKLRNGRLGGLKFRRQMSLNGFVVDFCCPSAKLIVELDGGQHVEQREQDARRTKDLEDSGYF